MHELGFSIYNKYEDFGDFDVGDLVHLETYVVTLETIN